MSACSHQTKVAEDDVVAANIGVTNIELLDQFVENVQKNKKDSVRVIHYTMEGDPIFQTLHFNGKNIDYTYDSTED
ncbi:DUF4362 domain-containing protein [Peribacillus deserti]|uniref:DUF4362 domain-containing protein n=1 Tax=Peribacillus deserti TaxID=673318 RepID=UPI0015E134B2|nr:DUF4362 domain-containing protein [Peribacillus deserti]